jgi:endonuclease IV
MKKLILGAHVSATEDLEKCFKHLDILQVFLTSTRGGHFPDKDMPFLQKFLPYKDKIPLIVHSPYTVSFVHPSHDRRSAFTRSYTEALVKAVTYWEIPLVYVTHLGVIPVGMSSKNASLNIERNLYFIDKAIRDIKGDFKIALENDSGTFGRSNINTAIGTLWLNVRSSVSHYKWLGSCFDTEHAFASGFALDGWEELASISDVIHLNPIPKHIIKGSCKDEHSKYLLQDSKEKNMLRKVIRAATKKGIPSILEKTDWELIFKDIEYLKLLGLR